jgi:heme exporter protein C
MNEKRRPVRTAAWKYAVGLWMTGVILGAFLYAGDAQGFVAGAARIMFFHIPIAEMTVIAFWTSMFYAALYLYSLRRQTTDRTQEISIAYVLGALVVSALLFVIELRKHYGPYLGSTGLILTGLLATFRSVARRAEPSELIDMKSVAAAEVGLLYCLLATLSGSIFARIMWNSFWSWDPRETSILVLLMLYGAYFGLRAAVEDEERRAALAAVYNLFAGVVMPFLVFVIPRIPALESAHPENIWKSAGMSADYRIVLYSSLLGFLGIFIWMFQLRLRVGLVELRREEAVLASSTVVK